MVDINENNLRRIDVNNLLVFTALMRERSVTRAAERLFLGQPAVSLALKRLRELFKDELFVRTRRGMEPTARAIALYEGLAPGFAAIQDTVFADQSFDPARAEITVRLGMSEDAELTLLPGLLRRLAAQAPGVQLSVLPADVYRTPRMLDEDEVDLALTPLPPELEPWHRHQTLREEHFLCVYSPRQLALKKRLALAQYLALPQVLVSATGQRRGAIDAKLQELGLARRVMLTIPRFSSLPLVLEHWRAIANVPSAVAHIYAEHHGLATCALPFETPRFSLSLVWHARRNGERALQWMRALLVELLTEHWPV